MQLRVQLHTETFRKFTFFDEVSRGNKVFLNWVANHFKSKSFMEGDIIYTEKDDIDGFYLLTQGIASFNLVKRSNMICGVIDSKTERNKLPPMSVGSFEFFGLEDTVLSHIKMNREASSGN